MNFEPIYQNNVDNEPKFAPRLRAIDHIVPYLREGANLLELGVSEGSTALEFARRGYKVHGVDKAKTGVERFLREGLKEGLNVTGEVVDLREFTSQDQFDLVYTTATLHFLESRKQIEDVIRMMKEHTLCGGLNYVSASTFTKFAFYFPYMFEDENELAEFYSDWDILESYEYESIYSNGKIGTAGVVLARKPN